MAATRYRSVNVEGLNVFYREAGPTGAPKLLLLHGSPTVEPHVPRSHPASRRSLPPHRAGPARLRKVRQPPRPDSLIESPKRLTALPRLVGLDRYAVYVFDYGAPTGFRLAAKHPERITAIVSQNGNAYEEGLSDGWSPVRAYWQHPSQANREALRAFLKPETTAWQYTHGVPDATAVSPDGYSLDSYYLARRGADEVQLDLLGDYKSNIPLYPGFQEYFRNHRPRLLAVWGKNDPFFLPPGAEAFKRDIPGRRGPLLRYGALRARDPRRRDCGKRSATSFPAAISASKSRRDPMTKSVAIVTGASHGIGRPPRARLLRALRPRRPGPR